TANPVSAATLARTANPVSAATLARTAGISAKGPATPPTQAATPFPKVPCVAVVAVRAAHRGSRRSRGGCYDAVLARSWDDCAIKGLTGMRATSH
ncbi:MAG: hypothetical protein J2P27_09310, partial [Actinobacteria bacterium]|nr:hypothetical protein [Actinomycetota bacterium]